MATPYTKVQNSFHSRIVSKYVILDDLEQQYLLNGLGDFELELYPLEYIQVPIDDGTGTGTTKLVWQFTNNLSRTEINILGALMYQYYLLHKIDEVMQLQNIVGKDISLTGIGQSKQEYNKKYDKLKIEIKDMINGLKTGSYSLQD